MSVRFGKSLRVYRGKSYKRYELLVETETEIEKQWIAGTNRYKDSKAILTSNRKRSLSNSNVSSTKHVQFG